MNLTTNLKQLLAGAVICMPAAVTAQETCTICFAPDDYEPRVYGTWKPETYDVAVHLADPTLAGSQVTGFTYPLYTTEEITDLSGWMSTALTLENQQNVPDIETVEASLDGRIVTVTFAQPYTLSSSGVYVGLSFTVSSLTKANMTPLEVAQGEAVGSFYIHSSHTNRKWKDLQERLGGILPMRINLTGNFASCSVSASTPENAFVYAAADGTVKAPLTLVNWGTETVDEIGFDYEIDGLSGHVTTTLDTPLLNQYGASKTFEVEFPAPSVPGKYAYTLSVTDINGKANDNTALETDGKAEIYPFLPVVRPLMEEYTGLWCGWCPRGYVALEQMNEIYGDRFVALSYHADQGDPMQTCVYFPNEINGFPGAMLNRTGSAMDPMRGEEGEGDTSLGIRDSWLKRCEWFSPADIAAEISLDVNGNVVCTAKTRFVKDYANADFRVSFAVVADNLTHVADKYFLQHSYYQGYGMTEPIWKPFTKSEWVAGLTFNDVVAAYDVNQYYGVAGSLPSTLVADEEYSSSFTYQAEKIVNILNEPMFQDFSQLRCVVMLFDKDGNFLNCAKSLHIGESGVRDIASDVQDIVRTVWHDMAGRELSGPAEGLNIRTDVYSDGSVRSSKVIVR